MNFTPLCCCAQDFNDFVSLMSQNCPRVIERAEAKSLFALHGVKEAMEQSLGFSFSSFTRVLFQKSLNSVEEHRSSLVYALGSTALMLVGFAVQLYMYSGSDAFEIVMNWQVPMGGQLLCNIARVGHPCEKLFVGDRLGTKALSYTIGDASIDFRVLILYLAASLFLCFVFMGNFAGSGENRILSAHRSLTLVFTSSWLSCLYFTCVPLPLPLPLPLHLLRLCNVSRRSNPTALRGQAAH